jgi:hypothetical protein
VSEPGRIGWYARRLQTMGAGEIAWRAGRSARATADAVLPPREPGDRALLGHQPRWGALLDEFRRPGTRALVLDRARIGAVAAAEPHACEGVVAAADRSRAHRFAFFGYPEADLGASIDWSLDPIAGWRWPDRPGARIDYRRAPADPKWVWELNRLQHLPWLAQAWLITGDDVYAEDALDQIDGWIAQSPPGRGIAWRGGFEPGIRAISLGVALQGLRDSPALTPERFRAAVRALAASADAAWAHRSLHSSANNHLVGELAGAAAVALLLPELVGPRRRLPRVLALLAREAGRQVLPDGAGAEQAFEYQVFTGDLLLVVAGLLRSAGRPVPKAIGDALARGADYMSALLGDDDPVPRYGDGDDGFALRLDAREARDPRGHLGGVAALIGHRSARRSGRLDLAARWIGGEEGERRFAVTTPGAPAGSMVAPDGGLVVIRDGRRRVTMDVGPLGYLAIAAHGHADALSVTVALDGREVITDPGAGSYFGNPAWRVAHRSTAVHATVTVDGRDQSEPSGPFMWSTHADCRLVAGDVRAGYAVGEHDGYLRLGDPVPHRRYLLARPGEPIVVLDWLGGVGRHLVTTGWPIDPDCAVSEVDGGHLVIGPDGPILSIAHAATTTPTLVARRAEEDTQVGWWSDRLESRRPAWLVGMRVESDGALALATVIAAPSAAPEPTRVRIDGDLAIVGWGAHEARFDLADPHRRSA